MFRRAATTLLILTLAAAAAAGQGMSRPDHTDRGPNPATPLPTDDRLTTGRLDNGMRYIIRRHENPPGKVGVWLHIGTGSLNETDNQRGLAHFLEHMAFNGSENFPPGEVVKYFESIGLTFGRDQNAFTSFDQTAYQLYLPDAEPGTVAEGLTFFADVARRLLLREEDIEEERGVILEELRTGRGPAQRLRDQWLERLAPGSLIGVRLPIGTEESINALRREDFLEYYNKWYVPGKMTLIIVGDLDPADAEKQIRDAFGDLPNLAVHPGTDAGVEPYTRRRAIVASDPEVTDAQVALIDIDRPEEPVTDIGTLRRDLIYTLAVEAFNRRLAAKIDAGEARMLGGGAFAQNLFGALRFAQASAASEPEKWAAALEDLVTEVRRAELHGFSETELETARKSVLASLEQDAQQEPTYPARAILARLNNAVASGNTISSPTQILERARVLIGRIRAGEVNRAFAELFDTSRATFLLTLPAGPGVPEEADVLALASGFADRSPEPDEDAAPAGSIMDHPPTPGEIAEERVHPGTEVWTAVLTNGVTVHHKAMRQRQNFVDVRITLLGGAVEENAENRGITMAAAEAFSKPATGTLTSAQIRNLMAGSKIHVTGSAQDDFIQIAVTGSPDDLETGMRLVHRLLTDPRLETVPFEQWRTATIQSMRAARRDPIGALRTAMGETIYPEDAVTARPVTPEQLERINIDDAQRWLEALIVRAPIEVAVVGDIDRDKAAGLVRTYLGSLPARPRMAPGLLADLETIPAPTGDRVSTVEVDTQTPAAGVIAGFFASDAADLRDTRLLQLASRTLSSRMIEHLREQERLVYSIQAQVVPAEAFRGYGLMLAGSATAPDKADTLATRIHEIFADFAESGPTDDELDTAKAQIAKTIGEAFEEPGFWSVQLSQLEKRGRSLDDFVEALRTYQSFTADEVRENFAKYFARPKFRVIVRPAE